MTAVPGEYEYSATIQDAHGDVGVVRFPSFNPDVSAQADSIATVYGVAQTLFAALAACMNGKIIKSGVSLHWSRAQKPAGPLSTYAHVYQRALLHMGNGALARTAISIPTPKTSVLLTDGITVNPADTNVAALIAAIEANCVSLEGAAFNEYLGGRFVEGKPRRRTNLYNSTA